MKVGSMLSYGGDQPRSWTHYYDPEQIKGLHMLRQVGRPLTFLAAWLGGWSRLVLLVLVLIGVGAGLLWEQLRHPPTPPGALQVSSASVGDARQTTFRYPGSIAEVRAFYQQALPPRGWRYCGTQATPRCTNMIQLVDRPGEAIDVYRRADDQNYRGTTVEIWPIESANGQIFVTTYETRSK